MAERYRYAAFISYSSKDARFAARLHKALESYNIPSALGRFRLTDSNRSNRVYPVFRDREELSAGHLGERIEAGLKQSANLIIICSPSAAASPWVQKEIESFIKLGRRDRIFAVIADSAPVFDKKGNDATSACFPPGFRGDALKSGGAIEPLAADARRGKDGFRTAVLKIVAGLIGVTPGQIIDRDRRARRGRTMRGLALSALLLLGVGFAYSQRTTLEPMVVNWWQYKRHSPTAEELAAAEAGTTFQDCAAGSDLCPVMVVIPAGEFVMGAPESDPDASPDERPQRQISVERFAVSRFELTFNHWAVCVAANRCPTYSYQDEGQGYGNRPVGNVSWDDAQAYVAWLSEVTGQTYRLLTEAEWEYAARAGSTTLYSWGDERPVCDTAAPNGAGFTACNRDREGAMLVGSFQPNAFGLYDMHGNASEWVQDCFSAYVPDQRDAASVEPDRATLPYDAGRETVCMRRVHRGGTMVWGDDVMRSSARGGSLPNDRFYDRGFRVARTL